MREYEPEVNSAVVSAVRTAFQRSRSTPRHWQGQKLDGRPDARRVWRVGATGRMDVFKKRTAPGASKVNVHILVDGSGSMHSVDNQYEVQPDGTYPTKKRCEYAADITATLADAFRTQPQVRLSVWLHNTMAGEGDVALFPVVTSGKGRENIGKMVRFTGGGNGDGYAIQYVGAKVKHDHRKDETDLLIVISDGLPSFVQGGWYNGGGVGHVKNVVQDLAEQDIKVLSVAIENNPNQAEMYTEDGVIPFDGDWAKLAVTFASALGQRLVEPPTKRR